MDEIGARVGVTGPAVYRHYPSKEALLAAVVDQRLSAFSQNVAAAATGSGGDLEAIIGAVVHDILDRPAPAATYLRERARLAGATPESVRATERRIQVRWLAAVRSAVPTINPVRAQIRQHAIVGAVTTAAREHRDVSRPRLDDLLVASAWGMATAPIAPDPTAPARTGWQAPRSKGDDILAAALALFRERGVSGVGIDEIGAAAGISGPTVYHYYPSKSAVVLDAYDRAGERVAAGVEEALRAATSAEHALDRLASSYVSVAADNVDLIVVTSREADALPPAERLRLGRRRRAVRDGWTAALREVRGDLAEAEARLLVGMVFPLVNHAVEAAEGHAGLQPEIRTLVGRHLRSK